MPYQYDNSRGWVGLQHHVVYRFAQDDPHAPEALRRFLKNAGVAIVRGAPRSVSVDVVRFDSFVVAAVTVRDAVLRWNRDRPLAQQRCLFLLISKGTLEFDGAGPYFIAPDGGISILFPAETPLDVRVSGVAEFLVFSFDVDQVGPQRLSVNQVGDVSRKSSIYRAAYSYLHTLIDAVDPDERATSAVLRSLTREMARALVAGSFATRHDRSGVYTNALAIIERRGCEAALTPTMIANDLGVSTRTLSRAFSEHGHSVSKSISAHRANLALALISHDPSLPTPDIATRAGFANEQTFARTMRSVFGAGPGALRKAAQSRH